MPDLTPIDWTDDDLDQMSSPDRLVEALPSARARWRDLAPADFDDLLDATDETDLPDGTDP